MTVDAHATREDRAGTLDVSVVTPVYNAMPYLHELLDSLAAQDLPQASFEVIAVDDGSTDESPAVLDEFAQHHSNVTVIHQENSGAPGHPRNVGLERARGRYVFFADADDKLGAEALRRLVGFADEQGSDIVIPRMLGLGERNPSWKFGDGTGDADLELALRKFTPHKLFRRSFLTEHDLRFPEENVRLEDAMMIVPAYYAADRVSALGDYGYYYLRRREDGGNITSSRLDPAGYTRSVGEVSRLIRHHDPDSDRADRIILHLFGRKCLKAYRPQRFAGMRDADRDQWIAEHQRFMSEFISPELESRLKPLFRLRAELVRGGDKEGLLALGRAEAGEPTATLVRGRRGLRSLRLTLDIELRHDTSEPPDLVLQLGDRGTETHADVPIVSRAADDREGPAARWTGLTTVRTGSATIPRSMLRRGTRTVIDVRVQHTFDGHQTRSRVHVTDASELPGATRTLQPFATKNGNLAFRVRPSWLRRRGSSLLRRGWPRRPQPAAKP